MERGHLHMAIFHRYGASRKLVRQAATPEDDIRSCGIGGPASVTLMPHSSARRAAGTGTDAARCSGIFGIQILE
jgi:hypothetical protein